MTEKKPLSKRSVKDDLSIIWDILKSITFFLGLYLFFIGWLYLFYYFEKFGIAFSSVSLDISSYYNYGFFALMDGTTFIIFFVFASCFSLVYYKRQHIRYAYMIILVMLISFFITSFYIVKNNAQTKALDILKKHYKLDPIYFDFTNDFLEALPKDTAALKLPGLSDSALKKNNPINKTLQLLDFNNHSKLYLIYENNESYFVIFNPNNPDSLNLDIEVYDISKKHTHYAKKTKSYNNE